MKGAITGRVEVGNNDCAGPAEHIRILGLCPKQPLPKKASLEQSVVCNYIDYFEVPDHNEIQNRSAGIL